MNITRRNLFKRFGEAAAVGAVAPLVIKPEEPNRWSEHEALRQRIGKKTDNPTLAASDEDIQKQVLYMMTTST